MLIDTSAWSVALRRDPSRLQGREIAVRELVLNLVATDSAAIIGPVRQELLSGVRDARVFASFRDAMNGLNQFQLSNATFDSAAECSNVCQRNGIAPSSVDMIVCAAAIEHTTPVVTLDADFECYARVLAVEVTPIDTQP